VKTAVAYEKGATIMEFCSRGRALMVDTNWVKYGSLIGDGHITLNNVYPTYTGATLKIVAAKRINAHEDLLMNWRAFSEIAGESITFPIDVSRSLTDPSTFISQFGTGRHHFGNETVFTSMWEDVYRDAVALTGYKGVRTYPDVTTELIEEIVAKLDSKFFGNTFRANFPMEISVIKEDKMRAAYVTPVFDVGKWQFPISQL
jgi:hypothetical protein